MSQLPDHTGDSYEAIAAKYAAVVDTKPFNVYYERPAVLSLLPPLANAKVLDAGCGPGWYSAYLLEQGAIVTGLDLNPEFVALTRERTKGQARVLEADLARPLNFAKAGEFDLIVSALVMHYFKDWQSIFREFYRVLRPQGILVFSTHHPFMDWKLFDREDYFARELLNDQWDIGPVKFYRRPLTLMSHDLESSGFLIERLLEPQPTQEFRQINPEAYERVTKNPWFLVIRARRKD